MPLEGCQIITTISTFTKFELVWNFRIDPDKIKVIHNPVLPGFKEMPKKNNKKPVILQIGSGGNKNVKNLIEACKGLNVKLLLINKLTPLLESQLKRYEIDYENRINLTLEELREAYIESDLLYFASTYEGFGMPIIEAQAVGRPVITSNIASMPEVGGNAVLLVDPFHVDAIRDGILKIIDDNSYSSSLVEAGLTNIKRFDIEAIAKQYLDLYYQLERE
jgi:glycosyltransferase involved in cell wall biosynthesis